MSFNGQDNTDLAPRGSGKYAKNQHSGHSNDGRLVNMGRGPTVAGKTGDQAGPCCATGKEQYRGVGGARAQCPTQPDHINYGKQMTRGNQ